MLCIDSVCGAMPAVYWVPACAQKRQMQGRVYSPSSFTRFLCICRYCACRALGTGVCVAAAGAGMVRTSFVPLSYPSLHLLLPIVSLPVALLCRLHRLRYVCLLT